MPPRKRQKKVEAKAESSSAPEHFSTLQHERQKASDDTQSLVDSIVAGLAVFKPEQGKDHPIASVEECQVDKGPIQSIESPLAKDDGPGVPKVEVGSASPRTTSKEDVRMASPRYSPVTDSTGQSIHDKSSELQKQFEATTLREGTPTSESPSLNHHPEDPSSSDPAFTDSRRSEPTTPKQLYSQLRHNNSPPPGDGVPCPPHIPTKYTPNPLKTTGTKYPWNPDHPYARHDYWRWFISSAQTLEALFAEVEAKHETEPDALPESQAHALHAEGVDLLHRVTDLLERTGLSDAEAAPAETGITLRLPPAPGGKERARLSDAGAEDVGARGKASSSKKRVRFSDEVILEHGGEPRSDAAAASREVSEDVEMGDADAGGQTQKEQPRRKRARREAAAEASGLR